MRRNTLLCLCSLALFLSVACNDDSPGGESSATEGDGDGDPTTGDGDGDPTTGDGDGDPTTGDGDGDPTTGDGDGDGDPTTGDGECSEAADCAVVNDCCSCSAAPADMIPPCDVGECLVAQCDGNFGGPYVPEAACLVGTCVLDPVSCDTNDVLCDAAEPPPCVDGTVRSVIDDCYGPCVLPSMCTDLPSECGPDTCGEGFACMTTQSGAPSRCVPLPPGCGGVASCDCISPWLGEVCNGGCSESGDGLLCEDGG